MAPVTAVIWDMDGVLLDTEPIYLEVESSIVSRYGKSIYDVLPKLLGRRAMEGAAITVKDLQLPLSPTDYLSERNALLLQRMPSCTILRGVVATVKHFKYLGMKQAIATSSPRDLLAAKKTGKDDFFALFDAIVCGDDVEHGKPHPEIFLKAASLLSDGVPPRECVVFEDAPAGIKAAIAAGMQCVALPNDKVDLALYTEEKPTFVVPSACLLDFDLGLLGVKQLEKIAVA